MFKFLGLGSAFNTDLGNTSCFIKEENSVILVDCGGTVFHQIRKRRLLEQVGSLTVIITHTHPDHIGSLGEVIFYAYYILKIKTKIYYPNAHKLKILFSIIGVTDDMVELYDKKDAVIQDVNLGVTRISFIPVTHLDTVEAYGFVIERNHQKMYYSGDSNFIPKRILNGLIEGELDRIYQDTSGLNYEGNGHMYIDDLETLIPRKYRDLVYCIHLDGHVPDERIKELGFQIPEFEICK